MRQKAANYALIYIKSFYPSLVTISPLLINPKITTSISTTNYSPPSSGRGWGRGFVRLTSFHLLLSTPSPPQINPQLTTPLPLRGTIGRCSWSLRNEESKGLGVRLYLPYTIVPFIINHVTLIIVSPCNSVRVVFLIARGWRGTSLPRGNVGKEIQRHRCWAFSMKALL